LKVFINNTPYYVDALTLFHTQGPEGARKIVILPYSAKGKVELANGFYYEQAAEYEALNPMLLEPVESIEKIADEVIRDGSQPRYQQVREPSLRGSRSSSPIDEIVPPAYLHPKYTNAWHKLSNVVQALLRILVGKENADSLVASYNNYMRPRRLSYLENRQRKEMYSAITKKYNVSVDAVNADVALRLKYIDELGSRAISDIEVRILVRLAVSDAHGMVRLSAIQKLVSADPSRLNEESKKLITSVAASLLQFKTAKSK
jgi:hypothetical protein